MKNWLRSIWHNFCEMWHRIVGSKKKLTLFIIAITVLVSGGIVLIISMLNKPEAEKIEIYKVEFVYEGKVIDKCNLPLYATDIHFDLRINEQPAVEVEGDISVNWGFIGETYAAEFQNGELTTEGLTAVVNDLGYVIGTIDLWVEVVSKNKIEATLPIQISEEDGFTFDFIVALTAQGYSNSYIEGQIFDKNSITLWGKHEGKNDIRILEYTYEQVPLSTDAMEIVVSYNGQSFEYPISVEAKSLQSLEIITPPEQVEYLAGQRFNTTGLRIQANYEYLSESVENFQVDTNTMLLEGTDSVQISYTYKDVTKTVEQAITVIPRKLLSLFVDDTNVQKEYTEGDIFDTNGLIVKAEFESFGVLELEDYVYNTNPLLLTDQTVGVSYTVGEITLKKDVSISVKKPYGHIGKVSILTPADIHISWAYPYQTEDGEFLDNTTYKENHLVYDKINGEYEIPVGATVTASLRNPAIISVATNGVEQKIDLVEKSFSWKLRSTQPISINSIEMTANHSVVRFTGDEKEQSFLYEGYWDGLVPKEDVDRLATVFADTDTYYYTYLVNGEVLQIEDIESTIFVKNAVIAVAKNARREDAKNVILNIGSNVSYTIRISNENVGLLDIPVFKKAGYFYDGWSSSENGEKLTDTEFTEMLLSESNEVNLYIRWIEEQVDYSQSYIRQMDGGGVIVTVEGEPEAQDTPFIGTWSIILTDENGETAQCIVQFNANATFEYKVFYNNELNCSYQGKYRLSGNSIVVIYSEPTLDVPYLNGVDFGFVLVGDKIEANGIIVMGQSIVFLDCELERIES